MLSVSFAFLFISYMATVQKNGSSRSKLNFSRKKSTHMLVVGAGTSGRGVTKGNLLIVREKFR